MKFNSKMLLLCLGLCLLTQTLTAQTVTFGDNDFKDYILTLVDAAGGGNNDGEVQLSEASNVDEIFYQNKTWTDHTGLEAFTNLRDLFLDNTTLGATIDLSGLTALEDMSLANTGISTIDLSDQTVLDALTIRANPSLTQLDVSNQSLLRILLANDCALSQLDLSKNNALINVDVDGNALESLNLRNGANATLTTMDARENDHLTCITVDDPTASSGYTNWTKEATTTYAYFCGDPFVTTWETTSPNESITIPTTGSGYNYYVDWGDGSTDNLQTGNAQHEYATAGTYSVSVSGNFPRIYFNMSGDRLKIKSIEQWGDIQWTDMTSAFMGCLNVVGNATDNPDLSGVTSLVTMFAFAAAFDGDLSGWEVGNITNMNATFFGTALNSDIGGWDVSNVTQMPQMLGNAAQFSHDIGAWNVAKVTNMYQMMTNTNAFDHDLSDWDVSSVTDMTNMLDNSGMSSANYSATLDGWGVLPSLQSDVLFGANGLEYCTTSAGRNALVNTYNWTISGDTPGTCPFDAATMVQVNDADFKTYLLSRVDANGDGQVQIAEAEAFTGTISYRDRGTSFSDATGLEAFINASVIFIDRNNLSTLDVSKCAGLTKLVAYTNPISEINLSSSVLLEELYLAYTDIETLNTSNLAELRQLEMVGTNLNALNLTNNTKLETLIVYNNALESLSLATNTLLEDLRIFNNNIEALDLKTNTALTSLWAQNMSLTEIDLSKNTLLQTLYLGDNALTSIDLSQNSALTEVMLLRNNLQEVNLKNGMNSTISAMNVTENAELDCILVDNIASSEGYAGWQKDAGARYTLACEPLMVDATPLDGVTDFPALGEVRFNFSEPIKLVDDLSGANLRLGSYFYDLTDNRTLEVDGNTLVVRPYFTSSNPRIDFESDHYITMYELIEDLDGNLFAGWSDTETYNFTVESQVQSRANYHDFSPVNNDVGVSTTLNQLTFQVTNLAEVTGGTIRLFGSGNALVKEWDLSTNTDWTSDGDEIVLSNLPELDPSTVHWIQHNGSRTSWSYTFGGFITADGVQIPAWGNDRIWQFTTGSGPTVTVNDEDFETYLLGLVDAANGGNDDGHIQVSEAESYTGSIDYTSKSLSDLTGLEAFINLTGIDLAQNLITAIDLSDFPDLTTLNLNDNSLATIDLAASTALTSLKLSGNELADIDLGNNTSLIELWLFDNDLDEIDVSALTSLERLSIFNLSDLMDIDLSKNLKLKELEVYSTGLSELDVTVFDDLEYLDISNTAIDYLDLSEKTNLLSLYAENTSLAYLNFKTGNHTIIEDLLLTGNEDLSCIEVDDVSYAESNWTDIDERVSFSTDCRSDQTIELSDIADMLTTDASVEVVANATSGLEVDLSITGPGSLEGTTLTLDGTAGTITIVANQSGNEMYFAAEEVSVSFDVEKVPQTISLTSIKDKKTTDGSFQVEVSSTSNLAVDLSVSGPASIEGNTITLDGTSGTVNVFANQSGDETFQSAEEQQISFEVAKAGQTLSIKVLDDMLTTDDPVDVEVSSSAELTVSLTVSGPASISGSTLTLDGTAGTVTVFANQSGDETFQSAEEQQISFEVAKAGQTLSIEAIDDMLTTDDPVDVKVSSSADLTVTLTVSGPASINGSTLTLDGIAGTVTVFANQAGNDTYSAAEEVSTSFEIAAPDVLSVDTQAIELSIYPNPATSWIFFLGIQDGSASVQIFNKEGRLLIEKSMFHDNKIDVSNLREGIYLLKIEQKHSTTTTKILIHR